MDRSYPYSRRLLSRARLRKRMAAVLVAGLVGASTLFMLSWKTDPISAAVPSPLLAFGDTGAAGEPGQRGARRIYPYSVVPGGVSDRAELQRVIRSDRVVAVHYASFNVDKARAVVVDKPRAVHVSYRKGDKVYWTAHKVTLAPGETLLSDGSNEMRARCANRISDVPQYPVEAHRPAMEELDQPVAEGEQYALGPDGLPVSMDGDGSIGGRTGVRFPISGDAGGPGAPRADSMLASTSSSAPGISPVTTMGLSGSSSSVGSPRPTGRPATSAPAPATDPKTGAESGSSSDSPTPSGGATPPAAQPEPGTDTPVSTPPPDTGSPPPQPDSTPPPGSPLPDSQPPATTPDTTPLPGTVPPPVIPSIPVRGPEGEQPGGDKSPPAPGTEPFIPKPKPGEIPPQGSTELPEPEPVPVPEPGSIWLFGAALAALLVQRRRRRG